MKNLRAGTTLAALLAAGLLGGCTQNFWEATPLGEVLQYEHPRVTSRKEFMRTQNAANVRAITAAIRDNKLPDAARAADAIAKAAEEIPRQFRRNTLAGKTTALPVIWQKKDDFDAKAKNLATTAAALAVVLRVGDKAGSEGALRTMQGTCGACHREYRVPPPPPAQRPAAPRS
ncbi:MAG: cytochrome c [Nitrospinota bacterium]